MPEITVGFGRTLIEEKPTGEHCFNCGDVMFEKQFRAWMTCMGEPIKKMTIKRRGEELPIVYCPKCEPGMRATFAKPAGEVESARVAPSSPASQDSEANET